jgi:N-acyl-D-amino-acid deacylase
MGEILLKSGTLIDGSGRSAVAGDLLIVGDRITETGQFQAPADAQVVDCSGLTISPGFIDAHSHSDLQVLEGRKEKVLQGVTTEVVGNCGFSAYPAGTNRGALHEFANGIFCGDDKWGWGSALDYLRDAEKKAEVTNVISLVGHGTLRIFQAGNKLGALPEPEVRAMESTLEEHLSEGASGFSTGLMYFPSGTAPVEELERLCRVVAKKNKIYTTHMRNYSAEVAESTEEQIKLAEHSGCRLQISHLQTVGPGNWPKQATAIEKIEKARDAGIDIGFDCYPYVAGSTVLTQLLPQWALEGGTEALLTRLADRDKRKVIAEETVSSLAQRWIDIYISAVGGTANQHLVGHHIEEIAELRGREPVEVVMDLISEEKGAVNMLEFNQSEDNLRQLLTHPLSNIVSDGFYVKGRPHPRLHGTFPLLLGEMCRKRRWLTLEEAIRKVTDLPAQRFRIQKRGRLERGYFADVAVFDAAAVTSEATYEEPEVAPVGIRYVFRNGRMLAKLDR